MKTLLKNIFILWMLITAGVTAQPATVTPEEVTEIYVATFDRAPDADGLKYWVNSGLSIEEIAESFFAQPETQKRYPDSMPTKLFIRNVYQSTFDRQSEEAGLEYWAEALDEGRVSRGDFILALIRGAQDTGVGKDKSILANKTEVGLHYAEEGLNDLDFAKRVMQGVTASASTVTRAKEQIDQRDYPSNPPIERVWGTETEIESGGGNAYQPQIAIDANGNALAVWRQDDGTADSIYANRYTEGSGWGTETEIESGGGDAYDPQIAIDANGNALAVWWQHDGTAYSIYANRYTKGSGWGTETEIESGGGNAGDPQIAMDANGNALAVWWQYDGTVWSIYANRYTKGSGWGTETEIESGGGDAGDPQIAMDANGNGLAVWEQYDGTADSIYANRYAAP